MHPSLEGFLTKVWNGRTSIPRDPKDAARHIYNTWYAVRPSASSPVSGFDNRIRLLFADLGGVTLQVQGSGEFFHVNPSDWRSGESVKKMQFRVYLNPKGEDEVLKVFERVVRQFVVPSGRADIRRPVKAKVAGAKSLGRLDTIVVYTPDEQTARTIARATSGSFAANRDTPAMTVPVGPSGGVSVGAEPPAITIFEDLHQDPNRNLQSFGNIRCEIIAVALEETLARKNPTDVNLASFKKTTADYLTVVGIDPNDPGRQKNKDNLETMWRAALAAKQRRR